MSWNYFTLSYSTYYGSQKRYKQVALSVMDSQYNQFTSSSTQISSNFRSDFFQLPIGIIWCVFCLLLGSGYYGLMACLVLLTRVSSLRTLDLPSRSDMLWPKQIWRLPQSWWRSPSLDRQTSAGKTTGGLCFRSQESRPNKSFVTAN